MRKSIFVVLPVVAMLAACSTTSSVAHYKASMTNVIAIKDQAGSQDKKVKVGAFTQNSSIGSLWCRAVGPVSIGAGKTPAVFVQEALQEELYMAGVYSTKAANQITGHLDEITFSSISPANWEIRLTLSSSNGNSYSTKVKHGFDTSWDAISACKNVTDSFPAAVQSVLKEAVSDQRFAKLF